jgi:hypothetical protein
VYGLINKAVQEVVMGQVGRERWLKICEQASLKNPVFVSFEQYPDEQTYALVGAAAAEMNRPATDLLEEIGEYWSRFTAQEGYGHLLDLAGSDFAAVISRLNDLHARLTVTLPELRPPSFECSRKEDGTIVLRYFSERAGLAHLVIGLLKGLAHRFGQEATVCQTGHRSDERAYDEFEVTLREQDQS